MKKLLIALCMVMSFTAMAQKPSDLEHNPTSYVDDFADIFTDTEEKRLDDQIRKFSDTMQISLVTVKDLAGYEISDYTIALGNHWGVGSKNDDGLMIVIVPRLRKVFVATGPGIQGDLPDAKVTRFQREFANPYFKKKEYFEGASILIEKYQQAVSPSAKALKEQQNAVNSIESEKKFNNAMYMFWMTVMFLAITAIIITLGVRWHKRIIAKEDRIKNLLTKYRAMLDHYNLVKDLVKNNKNAENIYIGKIAEKLKNNPISKDIPTKEPGLLEYIGKVKNVLDLVKPYWDKLQEHKLIVTSATDMLIKHDPSHMVALIERHIKAPYTFLFSSRKEYASLIKELQQLISANMQTRSKLQVAIQKEDFENIKKLKTAFKSNVDVVVNLYKKMNTLIEADTSKREIGKNAKDLIKRDCSDLLTYCDKDVSDEKVREHCRKGIRKIMREADMMDTDVYENYNAYTVLKMQLQNYQAPKFDYLKKLENENAKKEEANRLEKKKKKDAQDEEDRKRRAYSSSSDYGFAYSLSDSSSSSSSSDFGGGSFDGGGGGSDY